MTRTVQQLSIYSILVAGVLGCGPKGAPAGAAEDKPAAAVASVELTPVQLKTIQTVVAAQGVFAPAQGSSVKIGAIAAGRIASVLVKEGDQVQAGQMVAILENRLQRSQSESAAASLKIAQSQAKESELNAQAADYDQKAAVHLAELTLQTAQVERQSALKQAKYDFQAANLELKKAMQGGRPQEIAQAEQAERQAQVAKDSAERDEQRNALLLEHGIVSKKTYDDSKSALANAEAILRSAQSQSSLVKEGPRPEDKIAAQLKVESTKQALTSVQMIQDQKVFQAETALHQAQQDVVQVKAKRMEVMATENAVSARSADANAALATQAQLEIHSPISGRVVKRLLNPGDTPDNNSPILEIVSPKGGLDLVANLPASSGAEVRSGLAAVLTISASTPTSLAGSVVSIGQVDPASGMLTVRIRVNSPPAWLQSGTFATANIVIKEHANALAIPSSSVLMKDGAPIVYVDKADKAVLTKIEVGAEQDGFTEVRKGLTKGQNVVSLGNYELSDGASIKASGADDKPDAGDKKDDKKDDDKAAGADKK